MERIEKKKINKLNNILENPQTQQNRKEKIETKNRKTPKQTKKKRKILQ